MCVCVCVYVCVCVCVCSGSWLLYQDAPEAVCRERLAAIRGLRTTTSHKTKTRNQQNRKSGTFCRQWLCEGSEWLCFTKVLN